MTVVWKLSWCLRRLRRLLPVALTVLGLYFVSIYLFPSQKSHSHTKVAVTTTLLPPPTPVVAERWLIVNSTDVSLCNQIASEFSHWSLLFITTSLLPVNSSSKCHSLSGLKIKDTVLKEAYLYAIGVSSAYDKTLIVVWKNKLFKQNQQGADIIHIVRQTNDLANLRLLSHLPLDKEYLWTLVSFLPNSTQQFNADVHFGCLPSVNDISSSYGHCKLSPGIIAPVVLQLSNTLPKKLRCDKISPLVTVGSGAYADIRLTKAVFMRSTFWALPVFSSAAVNQQTEWSYIVQWLLWQTGHALTVYLPITYQQYVNTLSMPAEIINLLSQAECTVTFDNCIIALLRKLLSVQLISDQFVKATTYWLRDLKKVGYVFPTIKKQFDRNCSIPVTWSPVLASVESEQQFVAVANVAYSAKLQNGLCRTNLTQTGRSDFGVVVNLTHPWHQFRNLLLVVTFNKPHYEVIPYLELLYRSIFPHIVYCGPAPVDTASKRALDGYRISFMTYLEWPVHRYPGAVSYQCAIQTIRMNFGVDGFLFASDDLLLLPVPLSRLSGDRVWFVPGNEIRVGDLDTLRECHLGMCDFHPRWRWWAEYKSATTEALDRMTQLARAAPLFHRCLMTLRQQNGVGRSHIRVNGAYSDIFHIPSRIAHDFADVLDIFSDFGVFLEIAVPTVLKCIEPQENFQPLPGKQLETSIDSRNSQPWLFVTKSYLFAQSYLHPVKWSPLVNQSEQHVHLLCSKVLPYMHDPFSRLR